MGKELEQPPALVAATSPNVIAAWSNERFLCTGKQFLSTFPQDVLADPAFSRLMRSNLRQGRWQACSPSEFLKMQDLVSERSCKPRIGNIVATFSVKAPIDEIVLAPGGKIAGVAVAS